MCVGGLKTITFSSMFERHIYPVIFVKSSSGPLLQIKHFFLLLAMSYILLTLEIVRYILTHDQLVILLKIGNIIWFS